MLLLCCNPDHCHLHSVRQIIDYEHTHVCLHACDMAHDITDTREQHTRAHLLLSRHIILYIRISGANSFNDLLVNYAYVEFCVNQHAFLLRIYCNFILYTVHYMRVFLLAIAIFNTNNININLQQQPSSSYKKLHSGST